MHYVRRVDDGLDLVLLPVEEAGDPPPESPAAALAVRKWRDIVEKSVFVLGWRPTGDSACACHQKLARSPLRSRNDHGEPILGPAPARSRSFHPSVNGRSSSAARLPRVGAPLAHRTTRAFPLCGLYSANQSSFSPCFQVLDSQLPCGYTTVCFTPSIPPPYLLH